MVRLGLGRRRRRRRRRVNDDIRKARINTFNLSIVGGEIISLARPAGGPALDYQVIELSDIISSSWEWEGFIAVDLPGSSFIF